MICRKCGAELSDNVIRCSNCGIRVNMYCPVCGTLNPFGTKNCINCNYELLVNCSVCNSINVYSASECRKCHSPLKSKEKNDNSSDNSVKEVEVVESFSSGNSSLISTNNFQDEDNFCSADNDEPIQIPEIMEIDEIQNPLQKDSIVDDDILEKDYNESTENNDTADIQDNTENVIDDLFQENNDEKISDTSDNDNEKQYIEKSSNKEDVLEEETETDENLTFTIQSDAVLKVINIIKTSLNKNIIAINGEEGSGKSAVLNQVNNYLSHNGFISLYGSCTPLIQITGFGFFQDAFLRMMGFPPYVKSIESFIKDFEKSSFSKLFDCLDKNELALFLNIFYPSQNDKFENILENKNQMFYILEKVIKSFLVNNNIVISIDNFELLDGASYDFIVYLLKKGFFNNRLKLIAAYHENKSLQSYFDLNQNEEKMFETIVINKLEKNDLIQAVNNSISININEILDEDYLNELIVKANGSALRMEQEVAFLFDIDYIFVNDNTITIKEENKPENSPVSFEELIKLRINTLIPAVKNVLFMAAIMGYRFSNTILSSSVDMPGSKSQNIIDYLIQELFIQKVDNYTCEFKSLTMWKLIYQESKSDLLYKENAQRLYETLKPLILSSNLQKLISCNEALSDNEEFLIWQNTAGISAKLGDTNLYVIAQKQCLKIFDKQDIPNSEEIKKQIYEEIGKLLYKKSPKEAVTYLSNVLDAEISDLNIKKILDVSSYFIKSCYLTGNYFGAVETVDSIIKSINTARITVSDVDIALIKTRKLKALLNIGNSEQIINLVNEDIALYLEKELNSKKIETSYKNIIVHSLINSKIILAKAYALQGNNLAENVISEVKQFIERTTSLSNKLYYLTSINIIDAFLKTISGDISKSNEILNTTADVYRNKNMDAGLLAQWNLVNIINRVLTEKYDDLKVDLFELAAFTNNISEHFIKNVIKLILGYVLTKEGNTVKAIEIFNEEITYFAKEKVAIGALLSWALIVKISIDMGDIEKALNTASKSLEIAQSHKINNYLFIIYFQKLLAEIYLRKGDLTAAKMYLEKSVMIAKQFNLKYQLIELYMAYGEYMEEFMKANKSYSTEYIRLTEEMYNKASVTAKELRLVNMIEKSARAQNDFKTFCRLNSIEV